MKVEIWSDVACPYCYIGKRHLETALKDLDIRDSVDIEWKSFELDPNAKEVYDEDLYTLLANKYGQNRDWAIKSSQNLSDKGSEIGIEFNFDKVVPTNTFDAHRLIQLAKDRGHQDQAEEKLFDAYFVKGKHIGDRNVLIEIGREIGIDQLDLENLFAGENYTDEVRNDEVEARKHGISGVPFFILNKKYGISGAQPVEYFKEALKQVADEEKISISEDKNQCDIDGC